MPDPPETETAGMAAFIDAVRVLQASAERLDRALDNAFGPRCAECRRPWLDKSERWRTFLDIDDEPQTFCPECAETEFGR